jgi:uncharacterized membrane protein YqjE
VSIGFLIGLTRARVALIVMGLAWLFGLHAPPTIRITIAALVTAALLLDGLIDEQRIRHTADTKQQARDTYTPTA